MSLIRFSAAALVASSLPSPHSRRGRGLLQGQDHQPGRSASRSAAATTSTRRHLARHIGKHIPGNPTIVPQNMAGAGSLRAANFIYTAAPKDGTAFGTFARTTGINAAARKAARPSTAPSSPGSAASPTTSASASPGTPRR